MNYVYIIGNLATSPETGESGDGRGIKITNFNIAVPKPFNQKEADFFRVCTYNKLAENCAKFLNKGDKLAVCGYLTNKTYIDKQGVEKRTTYIIAREVSFLSNNSKNTIREQETEESLPF